MTASHLVLRTANASDTMGLVQLVNRAYRPAPGQGGWTHEAHLVSGNRIHVDQVLALLARVQSAVHVAVDNAVIVACVHTEKRGSTGHMGMLAVCPAWQGAGLGKRLLAEAEQYVTQHLGVGTLALQVLSSRPELLAFYLRRGYRPTGRVLAYPTTPGSGTPLASNLTVDLLEKTVTHTLAGCAKHTNRSSS